LDQLKLNEYTERAVHALRSALGDSENTIAAVASKSGAPMFSFSLPGDRVGGCGRMMIKRDGGILVWHRTMLRPWLPAPFEQREIGGTNGRGPTPAHQISLEKFESLEPDCFARVRQAPQANLSRQSTPQISDADLRDLATRSLAGYGWEAKYESGGIVYLNDGQGSSAAGRLVASGNIAKVWSHRGDIQLGSPWREGGPNKDGTPCHFATARDLAGLGLQTGVPAVLLARSSQPSLSDAAKIEAVQATWKQMQEHLQPCPENHRHLTKGSISSDRALPPDGLLVADGGRHEGAIAVPMLRDAGESGQLQVIGVQVLLTSSLKEGNDKMLLANSTGTGAFLPWPVPPAGDDGRFDLKRWIEDRDKSKPIVLCEGLATALAIHHSGAGHAIACFSSNNLPLVAKYLSDRELDAVHGIVVAADNDIGLTREGKIQSQGVPKAVEAARVCGGEVAFMGRSRPVGHDARDLYAGEGPDGVRRYIGTAQKPDLVQERFARVIEARQMARAAADIER